MKDHKTIMPPGSDLLCGKNYIIRYISYLIKNRFAHSADEYRLFPFRQTPKPGEPLELPGCDDQSFSNDMISFLDRGVLKEENIDSFFTRTGSTAFLVMKDGRLVVEKYYNGFKRDSVFRLYSITKSVVSTLVGIAIRDGLIGSVNDKITMYLPEFKKKPNSENITIRHLLLMNSGIRQSDGYAIWNGAPKVYLKSDVRRHALKCRIDEVTEHFHYNDYHPILLAMILERVTGTNMTDYLWKNIWQHLGAEYEAVFTCDASENMLEKAESGLNLRAVDLLRFGQLCLNMGEINGKQLIPRQWLEESTSPLENSLPDRYQRHYKDHIWGKMVFSKPQNYYKYFWWGSGRESGNHDFFALGILGQVLYISPENNAVAIRLGNTWTIRDWWPRVLNGYIQSISLSPGFNPVEYNVTNSR